MFKEVLLILFSIIVLVQCQIDRCIPNPCKNGGSCLSTGNSVCNCPIGFLGLLCEQNGCLPNPCLNGGTCTFDAVGNPICTCALGYSGKFKSF